MTAAREPVFYAAWGVPDTVQGRFEMIALHLVLVLRRLAAEGERASAWRRALTEAFVVDLDDGMREMTFGDLAVPREVKRAAAALFDRHRAYLAALGARRRYDACASDAGPAGLSRRRRRLGCACHCGLCAQVRERA